MECSPLIVTFYTREDCSLCDSALAVLRRVQKEVPFTIQLVDIDFDPALAKKYGDIIPVLTARGREIARSFFAERDLHTLLSDLAKNP